MDSSLVILILVLLIMIAMSNSGKKKPQTGRKTTSDAAKVQKTPVPQPAARPAALEQILPQIEQLRFEPWQDAGSMDAESNEGRDLCDPVLGHGRQFDTADPESVYANEIGSSAPALDLSARGIWQGVVMSEVLTRPSQRKHKR